MLLLLSLIIIISVGVVHGCLNCLLLRGQFVWSLLVCSSCIVHCPESRGCHISEVANTLFQWQFQSVLCCLSVVRRLSAFRGVRYRRFHCNPKLIHQFYAIFRSHLQGNYAI